MARVLWLEDQYDELSDYLVPLLQAGHEVDTVVSVTDAVRKMCKHKYDMVIVDLIVGAGSDKHWREVEAKWELDFPNRDPLLGLLLLRAVFQHSAPADKLATEPDPKRFAVFTIVDDKPVWTELLSFKIPPDQIVKKHNAKLTVLKDIVEHMK